MRGVLADTLDRRSRKSIDKFDALWHCLVPHISPKTFFNFHTIAPFAASYDARRLLGAPAWAGEGWRGLAGASEGWRGLAGDGRGWACTTQIC